MQNAIEVQVCFVETMNFDNYVLPYYRLGIFLST